MQEVTFDVETITPLFLAGADQETAELRAPSFRGVMRYWLRALVGGVVGTDTSGLDQVKSAEKGIFGATDTGSAIVIRISHSASDTELASFARESRGREVSGKDYLLWSMAQSGSTERRNFKPARKYLRSGTRFQVSLSVRGSDEFLLKQSIATFWLLAHLGSLGSRSRRCAGDFAVQSVKNNITDFRFDAPKNVEELQTRLTQGIQLARTLYATQAVLIRETPFDVLSQHTCRIWILHDTRQLWMSSDAAMRAIGDSLQRYRAGINPLSRRKIFGLPLKNVSDDRRASPLQLRLIKLQDAKYVGIAVMFKTKTQGIQMTDYTLIEQWVKNSFPQALEVLL